MNFLRHPISFLILICASVLTSKAANPAPRDTINLAGEWEYWLHGAPESIAGEGYISLPGTLDTNGIGIPVDPTDNTSQLSRRVTFTGPATYTTTVDIPLAWEGKHIELFLERTRPSTVAVDGVNAGSRSLLSAPHRYDLSQLLPPGKHIIEITVDNGDAIPQAIRNNSHACTESTQTNWNGIIGKIELTACEPLHIAGVKVIPKIKRGGYQIEATLSAPAPSAMTLSAHADNGERVETAIHPGDSTCSILLPLPFGAGKWSEWTPQLNNLTVALSEKRKGKAAETDRVTLRSGYRDFNSSKSGFSINGDPVFLRGRHDACVFPKTAHVPMDVESWREYFRTIKQYGLNHVRFHSWCPPEACFTAADEEGVYLQPELPIWGEIDNELTELTDFLYKDMEGILREYSHHPSFVMFAIGNELWGDIELMRKFIDRARVVNPELLATFGSNIYLGWRGHIEGEDFLVTCRVGGGDGFSSHARASFSFADADNGGIMNSTYPNSQMDFSGAIANSAVPVVGHETGQYQFYPDFSNLEKYDGCVLRPDNLIEFREKARKAGILRKNKDFFKASGEWATRLYLADMEMNLRTPGMGGFQLLDIQDYPGQGTALVGILDPFMDSKGFISPEDWRKSCSQTTILAEFPGFCFSRGDTVSVPVKVANFSNSDLSSSSVRWRTPFAHGSLSIPTGKGLLDAGVISLTMPKVKTPQKMQLSLSTSDGKTSNSYDIWVFPSKMKKVENVTVTKDPDTALALLRDGERVILTPDTALVKNAVLPPLFQTDYWNYRMFRTICDKVEKTPSPGTMGLLIDNSHPAFKSYPTSFHTDWQWFPVITNSYPLIIDRLPADVDPLIEVIDNIERNYRLALMLECNVGKGKLMILNADMEKASERPEGAWLLQSVKEYMASKECKPKLTLSETQLRNLLTKPSTERLIKEIRNESYNSQWE